MKFVCRSEMVQNYIVVFQVTKTLILIVPAQQMNNCLKQIFLIYRHELFVRLLNRQKGAGRRSFRDSSVDQRRQVHRNISNSVIFR
jgi:molybdate-binding protein